MNETRNNMDSQRLEARTRRNTNENYRKQVLTMLAKGERIRGSFDAEVYIQVRRNGRIDIYTSAVDDSLPLSKEILVSL